MGNSLTCLLFPRTRRTVLVMVPTVENDLCTDLLRSSRLVTLLAVFTYRRRGRRRAVLLVQPMLFDIVYNGCWQEIPHGQTPADE